jgi:hypothetical protein
MPRAAFTNVLPSALARASDCAQWQDKRESRIQLDIVPVAVAPAANLYNMIQTVAVRLDMFWSLPWGVCTIEKPRLAAYKYFIPRQPLALSFALRTRRAAAANMDQRLEHRT